MAKQTINIGASPNDGTGTPLRTAFDYTNQNFTELYTATGPSGNNIVVPGSATITGALAANADTTLGTASKSTNTNLNLSSDLGTQRIYLDRGTRSLVFQDVTSSIENYRIAGITGVHTWGVGGSTAMTLNSTGLGVGAVPSGNDQLTVRSSGAGTEMTVSLGRALAEGIIGIAAGTNGFVNGSVAGDMVVRSIGKLMLFNNGANAGITIDTAANVGIGVTPSAWAAGYKAIQIASSQSTALMGSGNQTELTTNAFFDGAWKYQGAGTVAASRYSQQSGVHYWYTAAAGAAGTAIGSGFTNAAMTLDASGNLLVGQTTQSVSTVGISLNSNGAIVGCVNGGAILYVNRKVSDGTLVSFLQDNTEEGTISVSGNTVSYNNFAGSHVSQLQDGSKTEILRGTVMESINELCVWPDEENERLPKSKISDTAGSKNVYGVFMAWDNEWTTTNDFLVTAVGAFICRVNGSITVQEGDLLESNGDGTARVQSDDIIRSSTIGKVTSTVKTYQYDDGSYCVPTVLYCG